MKSQVVRPIKAFSALVLAVVLAVSLVPLPHARAYADDGSLMAAQSISVADDDSDSSIEAVVSAEATDEEPEVRYSGVSLKLRGKVSGESWSGWEAAGSIIGDTTGNGLTAFTAKLTGLQGLTGSVSYRTYQRGKGWKTAVTDGKSTGVVRNVEAVKIKLTGTVSRHYDVLYRTYVSGKGWQPWVKNNAKSGITGSKVRVNAIQVKVSPKTEEALGKSLSKVGVRYETRLKKGGWQLWKGDGQTAGTTGKSKALNAFAVKADAGSLTGGVQYCAHNANVGWQGWVTDGATAGASQNLEAVKIRLTGTMAKRYDVYYQAHVANYGWLDWAKNGAEAGSTGYSLQIEAIRVKLVQKDAEAPGETQYPTVNLLEGSKILNGIDISSWQSDIDLYKVPADFVIVKATGGTGYTNPVFHSQADAALGSGKLLGLYHFARESGCAGSAKAEARYFVNAAKPYIGKAILFLDFEASALDLSNYQSWAKTFMDTVYSLTGVKPLIYTSKYYVQNRDWSSVASKYGLWVAQYPNYNTVYGYQNNPWTDNGGYGNWSAPTLFQYTSCGRISGYGSNLDLNKFYGSIKVWRQLASKS